MKASKKSTVSISTDEPVVAIPVTDESPEETETDAAPVEAKISRKTDKEMITITSLVDINPAPVVGDYDFRQELGIEFVKAKKAIRVPRNVGMRLLDTKQFILIGE